MENTVLTAAYTQWMNRLADQRFEELADLKDRVLARRMASRVLHGPPQALAFPEGEAFTLATSKDPELVPTHWAFGQLATIAKAPPAYLRTLPVPMVRELMDYGLGQVSSADKLAMLVEDQDDGTEARAFTSTKYGRIWDIEVVEAVEKLLDATGGAFDNPKDWSGKKSGLYASDRDVFLFFVDGGSIVDGGTDRDQLHRGFYVWNSEVGNAKFGISTFLFRWCCGNHMIWGAEDVTTFTLRHTANAPARFAQEAAPALLNHMQSSVQPIEAKIKAARSYIIPAITTQKPDALDSLLKPVGLTRAIGRKAVQYAQQEEGRCETLWELTQGLTAYARDMAHMDSRLQVEKAAGKLLEKVLA